MELEKFTSKNNNQPITIIVKPNSDALLDGPNKVRISIYNENTPRKWRKVKVRETDPNSTFQASIDKERLVERPIIKIKSNYFVDNIDNKAVIISTTTVAYNLQSNVADQQDYESTFIEHPDEYDAGRDDDETFCVTKRIETILT